MHEIILYEDSSGKCPIEDYLEELSRSNTKEAKIRRTKIRAYINLLKDHGLPLPENLCKHMVDKIYELRPAGDRVFFAGFTGGKFVLLHCYRKKGQKTPQRELKKAQEEFMDFIERWDNNGKD